MLIIKRTQTKKFVKSGKYELHLGKKIDLIKLLTIKSFEIVAIYRTTFSQNFREINEFQIDLAIWRNIGSFNSTFQDAQLSVEITGIRSRIFGKKFVKVTVHTVTITK